MSGMANIVEIRVKGRWVTVPCLEVNGNKLYASGGWLRTARVRGEEMAEYDLENPELYIEKLRGSDNQLLRADIFTFPQKPPAAQPKYRYPFEYESVATIRLASFKQWWEDLPQETRKNVRRSAKRGVVVRIEEFDDRL